MTQVVIDDFTNRLLTIAVELVKREAVWKKNELIEPMDIRHTTYNLIEKRERNFPKEKRGICKKNLEEKYGVNPFYLDGKSNIMFLREPPKKERATKIDVVEMNFHRKSEKKKVLSEIEALKAEIHELQGQLREYQVLYGPLKSDKKTDKKQ